MRVGQPSVSEIAQVGLFQRGFPECYYRVVLAPPGFRPPREGRVMIAREVSVVTRRGDRMAVLVEVGFVAALGACRL